MPKRLWILGASDPEMERIERLLIDSGEYVAHALSGGSRVYPRNAYQGASHRYCVDCGHTGEPETWFLVECQVPVPDAATAVCIDHHRPGDPGYGRPPAEFWEASSIGQVVEVLRSSGDTTTIPQDLVLVAAADHCLGAAYRGECPGVDPEELMRWRAETRAAFQGRAQSEVLADIRRASEQLRTAPRLRLCDGDVEVADMRRPEPVPELPEAATRLHIGYVSGPLIGPDGHRWRGHDIECNGDAWSYSDGVLVSDDPSRACGHCGRGDTPDGHDGCLGTLPGVMNACCGHGSPDECYVQFSDRKTVRGLTALTLLQDGPAPHAGVAAKRGTP